MKKFIVSFFAFMLIALTSVGGGLLLAGCDNSSFSESTGGGIYPMEKRKFCNQMGLGFIKFI